MTFSTLASTSIDRQLKYTFNPRDVIPLGPDALWKIERGVVRTVTWTDEGTLIVLGYLGPADVLGKTLFRVQPFQIECLTPVELSQLPAHLVHQVSESVVLNIQQAQELLTIVRSERAHQRLLNFLVWFAQKFGYEVERGQLIDLRLTHQDIAEAIGLTRVTVTRLLQQFEREGMISRCRHHLIVLHQP